MTYLESLYDLEAELTKESKEIYSRLTDTLTKPWIEAGGCKECLGHGRVITWSTLDGPGYTEYGKCTACTAESKALGKKPFSFWSGNGYADAVSGTITLDELFAMPEYRTEAVLLNTYKLHLAIVKFNIKEEEDRMRVERGKTIVVVAGRKIPRGTKGECFWVGGTKYGMRVGFKTPEGETMWTALPNVAVAA